ncbi:37353_t:CDS:2, partial [Gigaspora margarita]
FGTGSSKIRSTTALKYTFARFEVASNIQNEEQDIPNFRYEESSDDNSEDLEYDISEPLSHHDTVTTTNPANGSSQNSLIIRSMRHIIYNSLFDYWDKPIIITKEELKYQFSNCEQTIVSEHTVTSKNINIYHNRLHLLIFDSSISKNTTSNPLAELECYLDPMQTPIAEDIEDPNQEKNC